MRAVERHRASAEGAAEGAGRAGRRAAARGARAPAAEEVGGVKVVVEARRGAGRGRAAGALRQPCASGSARPRSCSARRGDGRVTGGELHAGGGRARLRAAEVVNEAAQVMGGGGGGRDTMAQAGGRDADKLPEALATARARDRAGARLMRRVLALDYGSARCGCAVATRPARSRRRSRRRAARHRARPRRRSPGWSGAGRGAGRRGAAADARGRGGRPGGGGARRSPSGCAGKRRYRSSFTTSVSPPAWPAHGGPATGTRARPRTCSRAATRGRGRRVSGGSAPVPGGRSRERGCSPGARRAARGGRVRGAGPHRGARGGAGRACGAVEQRPGSCVALPAVRGDGGDRRAGRDAERASVEEIADLLEARGRVELDPVRAARDARRAQRRPEAR